MNPIDTIANYVILSSVVPIGIFIYRYSFYSPFTKTPEGRIVYATKWAMFLILGLGALGLFFPEYAGRSWVRLGLYTALLIFFIIDLILLWKIQRKYPYNRRKRK